MNVCVCSKNELECNGLDGNCIVVDRSKNICVHPIC